MTSKQLIFLILIVLLIGAGFFLAKNVLPIATSYAAKTACSCLYVSGRERASLLADLHPVSFVQLNIDRTAPSVSAHLFGLAKRTALFREGLGCTLASEMSVEELRDQAYQNPRATSPSTADLYWPTGDVDTLPMPAGVNLPQMDKALDWAFSEPDPDQIIQTRAVIAVYKGKIVAERYAEGFDATTPLLGWSMAKSVTNALTGILVKQGKLNLQSPAPVPEWQEGGDLRREITLDQLLRMSSGLSFEEVYGWKSDATEMLFLKKDAAAVAASLPLEHNPDTEWSYSSGTSNIISRIIRSQFEDHNAYLAFPYRALFDRIGMSGAQIEPDPSGTYVGSSYLYAPARDWARFGLLYLQDGIWEGERILPDGWVDYSRARTTTQEHGLYAAHFWTNALKPVDAPGARYWPNIPEDAYYASGHEGQQVFIVPSRNLVLVRLGMTPRPSDWNIGELAERVLAALP